MQPIFKFLIKDKVIPVQPFDKLMLISKNIRNELIFSGEHSYRIESKVRDEIIEDFIKYVIFDEMPEITINNINEYEALSEEFSILKETIKNKKNEYGEYLINLNGVSSEDEQMRSVYEERISSELDEYLTRYGKEMMKMPIQTLYNIFNHRQRKLNNHNLAYEHIISHFDETHDSNIFILLDLLDGNKLTRKNIEESYSLCSARNNHMPQIDFSTINEIFSIQRKQAELLEKLSSTINSHQIKQKEQERIIENQKIQYDELLKIMNERQQKQEELLEEQRAKYEELFSIIHKKQEQDEIDFKKSIETLEEQIKYAEQDKKNLNKQITKLEKELENFKTTSKSAQNNCQPFIAKLDRSSPGILQRLKNNEKSPFDKLFIPSQSSGDIYNIIDPNTNDNFCIAGIGNFIEIELEKSITINGIKFFSSTYNFPKSFDIEIDNEKVASIKEAKELNGENQEMTINVDSVRCNKIRIISKGQNWDKGSDSSNFKRIELLSNEPEYSGGVFSTLVNQSDPHKCHVLISASNFDFNTFHSIDSITNISTKSKENSWFQIEFPKGKASVNGFRLKKYSADKLKQYKIICTDDVHKPLEEWTTLFEIEEKSTTEHEVLDIYEFSQPSPPIKFIRFIQTGPDWRNELYLMFYHFDIFGSYI